MVPYRDIIVPCRDSILLQPFAIYSFFFFNLPCHLWELSHVVILP